MAKGRMKESIEFMRKFVLPGLLIWLGGWLILFFMEGKDNWYEPVTHGELKKILITIGGFFFYAYFINEKDKKNKEQEIERATGEREKLENDFNKTILRGADIIGESETNTLYRTQCGRFLVAVSPDDSFPEPLTAQGAWEWCWYNDVDPERIWKRDGVEAT
jgi:hypothetical protein